MRSATVTCALVLEGCYLDEPINLREAEALTVRLPGCHMPGLVAAQLEVAGNLGKQPPSVAQLELNSGFTAKGTIRLAGARIGGQLNCDGARLTNPDGRALDAYQLTVGRDVYFRKGFAAEGEVHLSGAQIAGALNCSGGHFTNRRPDGRALGAPLLTVGQSAYFREGFTAEGEVNLSGARIGGQLNCNGANLNNRNSTEPALNAAGMIVDKDMHCLKDMDHPKAFTAEGEVRLTGARIVGQFNCDGATLTNQNGRALNAYRLSVGQYVYFRNGFAAVGEVHLSGAKITGSLNCPGGSFTNHNPDGSAIGANALTVGQDVNFRKGFTADGEVNLVSAQIGGQLNCEGAILTNTCGRALNAYRLTVGQDVFCKDGFRAEGEVHLNGAQIGGSLNCSGGSFINYSGDSFTDHNPDRRAIDAYAMTVRQNVSFREGFNAEGEVHLAGGRIGGQVDCSNGCFRNKEGLALNLAWASATALILRPKESPDGAIRLNNAKVGNLDDDPKTWPKDLYLRGFVYDSLKNEVEVEVRYPFLERDLDGYSPQPYEQLAAVYRRAGEPESARKVLIAKQKARHKALPPVCLAQQSLESNAWNPGRPWVPHLVRCDMAAWVCGSRLVGI